jgi:cell wall-associated NlpC family hydrolase
MLDNPKKKRRDGLTVSIIFTMLFVSASSAVYDLDAASASGEMYSPILQPQSLETLTTAPAKTLKTDLLAQLPNIGKLSDRIENLELTLEQKNAKITAIKQQNLMELAEQREIYETMDKALQKLISYVGKTPYGFGDDPKRWDCSGLTMWFYQKFRGIELPHSATAQMREGEIVDAPIPGDLVAFKYRKSSGAFHIGVYVGSGLFIHAKNHSADTVLESVENFAKNGITVVYVRY